MSSAPVNAPKPKKSRAAVSILIFLALTIIVGIGAVQLFGKKVERKFSSAQQAVSTRVSFGNGGGAYHSYESPSPAYKADRDRIAVAPAVQPEPEPEAEEDVVTRPTELVRVEPSQEYEQETQGGVKAHHYGVNPLTKTSEDRLSTFSIDVDTASYTMARANLMQGFLPPQSSVRVEEFVNYFNYQYPSPKEGAFGVNLEAAPSPFSDKGDRYLMRVGVQGKYLSAAQRKPAHLTFLVDVSGSMGSHDKLPLAQGSMKKLVAQLGKRDSVSIVTYAGNTQVILEDTSGDKKSRINQAIDALSSGGGTAMGSGMELAYKEATKHAKSGHISRVIVLSDGDANIGNTSHSAIFEHVKRYIADGITLSTIGFGMHGYNDTNMERLANEGNGNYYFVDTPAEADRIFGEQVNGTLEVIAKDVKIQVEFNPEAISHYRLIGYENRDIADKDFRNDAVDAGEIGAGHAVTALYEVVMNPGSQDLLARVRVRHKDPNDGERVTEHSYAMTRAEVRADLSSTSESMQFAAAVAAFAELLRGSTYASHLSYELVREIAQGATSEQADRKEFLALVDAAIKAAQQAEGFR